MAFGRKREPIIALDHPDYPSFLKAIDEIIIQKPDVLVHAGDLFDTVKPKTRRTLPC
jgi:DNA repair exonuclease SbcCD nuclease subunit